MSNFTKENYKKDIQIEYNSITDMLELLENKKIELLKISNTLLTVSEKPISLDSNEFYNSTTNLKSVYESIQNLETLCNTQKETLNSIKKLLEIDEYDESILENLEETFAKQKELLHLDFLKFDKQLTPILNSTFDLSLSSINNPEIEETSEEPNNDIMESYTAENLKLNKDNRILLISEKDQKAYLPYKIEDIENLLNEKNSPYTSAEDVIKKEYILPLKRFQNSTISRFKESYNLIRNKENGSVIEALDLGFELMFNYSLNPIIIAACRNLEELNIYLDCLDEQELYDFDCFEVRFEIAPIFRKQVEEF